MTGPSRFAIAKDRLLGDVVNVVGEILGANAREKDRKRAGWNVTNPFRPGAKPDQMYVWLTGARAGGWKDFVSGDSGDIIDLVAFGHEGVVDRESRMRAVEWTEQRYGLRRGTPAENKEAAERARERRAKVVAEDNRRRESARDRARKMFFGSAEGIAGTLAETYLAGRGIALAEIPNLEPAFRFRPAFEYWLGAPRGAGGAKLGKGPDYPAMVSGMVDAEGRVTACHITYLARDGRGKAPVDKAKLMWPETQGLVIRVTCGPSGLGAEKRAAENAGDTIAVTEGIEDAMTIGFVRPELRVWAAGSLSGLLAVPDHPAARAWLIFKDNDWGKRQAQALFDRAVARIRAFGKPVEVIAMPATWGKDVNDAINHERT